MEAVNAQSRHILYPPGGILIWLIIIVELATFAGGFTFFYVEQSKQPELFSTSREALNQHLAILNTLILVISGYFAANAVYFYQAGKPKICVRNFLVAAGFGVGFIVLKGAEYYEKIKMGITLGKSTFFDFYWLLTGFHLAHVILGIILLVGISNQIRKNQSNSHTNENVETVAAFWHLCDLIWVFLLPVIYLN